jgi:DNA-binding transcriptional regulator YiaG
MMNDQQIELFGDSHDSAGKRKVTALLKLRAEMLDQGKLFKHVIDMIDPNQHERIAFAELLLAWRVARGISLAETARRLRVPYRTLQDWQAGIHTPRGYARLAIEARLRRRPRRRK